MNGEREADGDESEIVIFHGSLEGLNALFPDREYAVAADLAFSSEGYPHGLYSPRRIWPRVKSELRQQGYDGLVNMRTVVLPEGNSQIHLRYAVEGTPILRLTLKK